MIKLKGISVLLFSILPFVVWAAEPGTDEGLGLSQAPLAQQGDVVLTQAEIDAAFSKIPAEYRLPFIRSGDKVEALVRNLLKNKILAGEARKAAYDQETLVKLRLGQAHDSELAEEWLDEVVDNAPPANYEVIAYEQYLLKPEAWQSQERTDVSHILISSETRSSEKALELANGIYEQLVADPSLFDSMVTEYSEDSSVAANAGRFPSVKRDDMVKPFEEVAFALRGPGEISAPVETEYGFHIIRLNQYFPPTVMQFEDIKDRAVEQVEKQYHEMYLTNYLRKLLSNPIVLPDGAAEEMAKRYFGENLELAPEMGD